MCKTEFNLALVVQKMKNDTHPRHRETKPILADAQWQTVVMDLVEPLTATMRGNK